MALEAWREDGRKMKRNRGMGVVGDGGTCKDGEAEGKEQIGAYRRRGGTRRRRRDGARLSLSSEAGGTSMRGESM